MVAAFDYCLHGKGGAAPSIDTAMHGLVDAAHVDHLHPDSGIAIATAADGEAADQGDLRRQGRVGAVAPARASSSASTSPRSRRPTRRRSAASSAATASPRGATPARSPRRNSLWIIDTAAAYIAEHSRPEPFGPALDGYAALPEAERRAKAAALAADHPRARLHGPADGRPLHRLRRGARLPRLAPSTRAWPRSAPRAPTTSCAPRSSRWSLDLPATASVEEIDRPAQGAARALPRGLPGATTTATRPPTDSPAIRGADPLIVLVPGVGHVLLRQGQADRPRGRRVLRQRHQRDARRRGALDVRPDRRGREVPDRVLGARGGQAPADAEAQAAGHPHRAGHRRRVRHRQGHRHPARRRGRLRRDRRPRSWRRRRRPRPRSANADVAVGVQVDVSDEAAVQAMVDATVLAFGGVDLVVNNAGLSLSKPLLETTVADWDLQHDVMAKGSFLVSRAAAKVLIEQELGGDIVYISSKNSVFAGPNNIAYSAVEGRPGPPGAAARRRARRARHQGQRRQPRRRRAGLRHLRQRLGRQPRRRLRRGGEGPRQVLRPAHPAQARGAARALRQRRLRALLPELSRTTGLHIPVDSGVAAAFLR